MIEKYNAFISYKHAPLDNKIAAAIQRDLERYVIPRRIRRETGMKKIERIFRDQAELPITSDLDDNIGYALEHSDFLIVICSESTRLSTWVPREIEYFLRFHPISHVLTVLAEGEPAAVIPEILRRREDKLLEPLSCDYRLPRRQAKRRELPRLAAAIIGCSYDELIMRARQYRMRRLAILGSAAAVLMSTAIAYLLWSRAQIQANYRQALINQSVFLSHASDTLLDTAHDGIGAAQLALSALGDEGQRPVTPQAVHALTEALHAYTPSGMLNGRFPDGKYAMGSAVRDFSVSADGNILFVLDESGEAAVFDILSQERLFTRKFPDAFLPRMFLLPCGEETVLLCDGFVVFCQNWRTGEELWQLPLWKQGERTLDPEPAGAYKRQYIQSSGMISPDGYVPVAAALSPDGTTLAVDGMNDTLWLVDVPSGEIRRTLYAGLVPGGEPVSAWQRLLWSGDGRWLCGVYLDGDALRILAFAPAEGTVRSFDTGDPSFENLCFIDDDTVAVMTRDESWNASSLMAVSGLEGYGATLMPSVTNLGCYSLSRGERLWTRELSWHAPWKNSGQLRHLELRLPDGSALPVLACSASNMAYLVDETTGEILCDNEFTDSVIAIMDYSQVLLLLRNGDSAVLNFNGVNVPHAPHTQLPHFVSTSTPYELKAVVYRRNEEGAAYYCATPGGNAVLRYRRVWDHDGTAWGDIGVAQEPAGLWRCGEILIVYNDARELLGFDAASGERLWTFRPEDARLRRLLVLEQNGLPCLWLSMLDDEEQIRTLLLDPADGSTEALPVTQVPMAGAGDTVCWIEGQSGETSVITTYALSDRESRSVTVRGLDIPEEPTAVLSPDGKKLGVEASEKSSFWLLDLTSGESRQVTDGVRTASLFVWSETGDRYAVAANTGILLCTAEGETLREIPTDGRFAVDVTISGDKVYVLYRSGALFIYRFSDGALLGAAELGLRADETLRYSLLPREGRLFLQAYGDSRWLAVIDEETMTLESFIENAVGYFPESEKILVGTQSSSDNAYILTAFDRYTSAQLREKARAFIGGNAMSAEMLEQYGLSSGK